MLNITTRQELLSRIVDTLGIVVEDARFDFDENGLSVRVVDPSHVAMVKLDVDSAVFDSWEVEETKIGLELKKLKETLGLGSTGDLLTMDYSPEKGLRIPSSHTTKNLRFLYNLSSKYGPYVVQGTPQAS